MVQPIIINQSIHHVSLPILSEITGRSIGKLRKMYHGCIASETIPLSLLPHEHQDAYLKDYLLRDRLLDLDLLRLIKDHDTVPPLQALEIQALFKETRLIRQAVHIAAAYAATRTITPRLTKLAITHGISYRTLVRKRSIFMNQSSLMKLLDDPSLTEDVQDRYPTCCFYARDFIIHRHFHTGRPSGNSILRELQKAEPLPCSQCPYHPINKNAKHRKGDFVPQATCRRNRDVIRIPNRKDTVNLIIGHIPEQETCLAWEGVRSWASKYHYTPARKKGSPEKIGDLIRFVGVSPIKTGDLPVTSVFTCFHTQHQHFGEFSQKRWCFTFRLGCGAFRCH